jgi:hypothetical protein
MRGDIIQSSAVTTLNKLQNKVVYKMTRHQIEEGDVFQYWNVMPLSQMFKNIYAKENYRSLRG